MACLPMHVGDILVLALVRCLVHLRTGLEYGSGNCKPPTHVGGPQRLCVGGQLLDRSSPHITSTYSQRSAALCRPTCLWYMAQYKMQFA